ncbi:Ketol-acid reductoisomerase [Flavobacterium indicum GPTSA100-9 = DSM 17447]|uniref:Ketol-acid reductoisomerase n=1 Tax=Flavobacterium indicum (strain DSM 17447 / CIP 109464 / GPTSA100-9) TaxID=1094466 RepID=H8XP59_FLAIG|nr:ketol-acid reductoisomerase [Flavobacterium indicum]CCG53133.1 Ketol-acid reductoisomerase [Flavobacterium indicum GPTSA100-9 = DSM 17447]
MAKINFGGIEEQVITREEFPLEKALDALKYETIAVIGYGVQGPGQSLNLRDNGFNVIVGQRKGSASWKKALQDGWVENENLFDIEEACDNATIIQYLLSDAGQIEAWNKVKKYLTAGKTLYFSHGFGITFNEQTGIVPPEDIDVILVAPKGSGTSLRRLFLKGEGINSSIAVYQDATGRALEKAIALGIGVGSGYLFETDFKKEVFSDLTGERGILMGALAGLFEAQYEVLRKNGHSPSEAFNETVEELTQSLMPLVAEKGMDWMFANTSVTAQRGALDWKNKFKVASLPVFEELYEEVASGREAARVIQEGSRKDYREKLEMELTEIRESELWKAGAAVRTLRPRL